MSMHQQCLPFTKKTLREMLAHVTSIFFSSSYIITFEPGAGEPHLSIHYCLVSEIPYHFPKLIIFFSDCNINETLIRASAEAMVSSGLAAAGYNYVNLDDCWASSRNATGFIQADPVAFPSGMKALADYVYREKGEAILLSQEFTWNFEFHFFFLTPP